MTAALVGLSIAVVGLALAAVLGWRANAKTKDENIKLKGINAEQTVTAAEIQAKLMKERDEEHSDRVAAEQQFNDEHALRVAVEMQRDDLSAELAAAKAKLVASLPVGEEGAAIGNDEFSTPLLGGKP